MCTSNCHQADGALALERRECTQCFQYYTGTTSYVSARSNLATNSTGMMSAFPIADTTSAHGDPMLERINAPARLPSARAARNDMRLFLARFLMTHNFGSITRSTHAAVAIAVEISVILIALAAATWAPEENASSAIAANAHLPDCRVPCGNCNQAAPKLMMVCARFERTCHHRRRGPT